MPGHEGGLDAARREDAIRGDADREDRGLCVLGEDELVFGTLETISRLSRSHL